MGNNLWDDPEEEFRDIPDEARLDANSQPMQSAPVRTVTAPAAKPQAPQPYRPPNIPAEPVQAQASVSRFEGDIDLEDLIETDDEDDFSAVLNDANLRIEQGRLYQMIMNHDLFEGMDADPKSVQNVQKEIRKFARERMEVMLGMRKETSIVENLEIDFPFNALEVEVLKKLAFTATKGATQHSDNFVPEVKRTTSEVENVPRRTTLNPIGNKRSNPVIPQKQPQKQAQKLPSQPTAPLKRQKLDATIDQICAEEGIPRELLEEGYKPLGKPLPALSQEEAAKRARETAQRLASKVTVKSPDALPMASPEQQEMLAVARATQVSQGPGMAAILDKVSKMPRSLNHED